MLGRLQGEGSEYYGGTGSHRRLAHAHVEGLIEAVRACCSQIIMTRRRIIIRVRESFKCHKLDRELCHILSPV